MSRQIIPVPQIGDTAGDTGFDASVLSGDDATFLTGKDEPVLVVQDCLLSYSLLKRVLGMMEGTFPVRPVHDCLALKCTSPHP